MASIYITSIASSGVGEGRGTPEGELGKGEWLEDVDAKNPAKGSSYEGWRCHGLRVSVRDTGDECALVARHLVRSWSESAASSLSLGELGVLGQLFRLGVNCILSNSSTPEELISSFFCCSLRPFSV
jgi:hypothetical protein